MSRASTEEQALMSAEHRLERSKRIRRQMDDAVRFWAEGLTVTVIAERLGVQRNRVYFLLRALELLDARQLRHSRAMRNGQHLYCLKVPPIEDSHAA